MNIKQAAKAHGMTLTQVAAKMKISRITLMQTIQRNPTQKTLQRIADAIGCDISEFFLNDRNTGIIGFVEIDGKIHKVESAEDIRELCRILPGQDITPATD